MGWASAGDIFDPVAQALINAHVADEVLRDVLGTLIGQLQDGDWDTESESLDQFSDNLVIRSLFYNANVGGNLDDGMGPEGELRYVDGDWCLGCEQCGLVTNAAFTAEGHDQLLRTWVEHLRDHHGGTGRIDTVTHRFLRPDTPA